MMPLANPGCLGRALKYVIIFGYVKVILKYLRFIACFVITTLYSFNIIDEAIEQFVN